MLLVSYKAADLRRDPRILVHSIVTARDGALGEYKVRGRAVEESSAAIQAPYAEQVRDRLGWRPEPGRGTSATSLGHPEPYRDLLTEP